MIEVITMGWLIKNDRDADMEIRDITMNFAARGKHRASKLDIDKKIVLFYNITLLLLMLLILRFSYCV